MENDIVTHGFTHAFINEPVDGHTRNELIFLTSQKALQGILSGTNLNILLTTAMQGTKTQTLGTILADESWAMAEALVNKYELELSLEKK